MSSTPSLRFLNIPNAIFLRTFLPSRPASLLVALAGGPVVLRKYAMSSVSLALDVSDVAGRATALLELVLSLLACIVCAVSSSPTTVTDDNDLRSVAGPGLLGSGRRVGVHELRSEERRDGVVLAESKLLPVRHKLAFWNWMGPGEGERAGAEVMGADGNYWRCSTSPAPPPGIK